MLILLVGYAIWRSVVAAASKPFWFDEMCTWVVAHQAHVAAVWADAGRAIEPNPPLFYVVEHFFGEMLRNEQVAYRLPSIFGFACILVCVFIFVRRRGGAVLGMACAAVLLTTIAFDRYALDARPYALEMACIGFAMVCYQRAPVRSWMILMGASLALAASFHYYAVFALVPFAAAETGWELKARVLRPGVWIALGCGVAPLAIFWPMLARVRDYFGPHFWAKATLRSATDTYGWLFEASQPARATIAFVLLSAVAVASFLLARSSLRSNFLRDSGFSEYVLCASLLALPLVILAAAKITGGGMTARYALPTLLGVPAGIAYLAAPLKRGGTVVVAVLVFMAVGNHERQFWAGHSGHFGEFASPARPLEEMLRQAGYGDLPVVISNGLDYLSIVHYVPPEQAARLVALVDPAASIAEVGNDSLDKGLLAIRCCMAIQVYDYPAFLRRHPAFLVYSDGNIDFDRWPQRLLQKRLGLNLLAVDGPRNLYLVDSNDSAD